METQQSHEEEGLTNSGVTLEMANRDQNDGKKSEPKLLDVMQTKCMPFIPVAIPVILIITIVICYPMAVTNDHVRPIFPYLFDITTLPPEAGINTLTMFLIALLILATGEIRFFQIYTFYDGDHEFQKDKRQTIILLNKISAASHCFMALGLLIAASFRITETMTMHLIGAALFFGMFFIFLFTQTLLSKFTVPNVTPRRLFQLRLIVAVKIVLVSVACTIFTFWSVLVANEPGQMLTVKRLKWAPEDGGFYLHVMGVICEWFAAVLMTGFMGLFYFDFKRCKMIERNIRFEPYK